MDMDACGAFIRACRTERGMSQRQLAQELHVTREAVSKWENGRGFPDASLLQPLARALGVSASELLLAKKGERGEEALDAWLYLTDQQRQRQRRGSRRLLLGALFFAVLGLTKAGVFLVLPLGLAAAALPLVFALEERLSLGSIVLSSLLCCFSAACQELIQLRQRVLLQDWAGLADTAGAVAALCAILFLATLLANALLLSGRRH